MVLPPSGLGGGAARAEVLAAPGHLVAGVGLPPVPVLHLRAVGPVVGLVNAPASPVAAISASPIVMVQAPLQAPAAAPVSGSIIVILVQAPLQAPTTAPVSGSIIVITIQAPLQAPATAPVSAIVIVVQAALQAPAAAPLLAARTVVGMPPLQAVLPAVQPAPLTVPITVPTAGASSVKVIHHLKSPVFLIERKATLQRGQLDLPGPLDHLVTKARRGERTITIKRKRM